MNIKFKIDRRVLKRAKANLDNLDAKLMGVILNGLKPEAGPEYYKYHSHYYYDKRPDEKIAKPKKIPFLHKYTPKVALRRKASIN